MATAWIQQNAPTEYVTVGDTKYAYRLFGLPIQPTNPPPLLFLQHFRGTMDHWDPNLINPLSLTRPILLVDNSGIGLSTGCVPHTFAASASNIASFLSALHIPVIDVLGFSQGGMVAQMLTLNYPTQVRRLVLAGTGPSAGEGVLGGEEWAFGMVAEAQTGEELRDAFLKTFYSEGVGKQELAERWWERLGERKGGRGVYLSGKGTNRSSDQMGNNRRTSSVRLGEITCPVFVANGDHDILVPTENSIILQKRIHGAHLHIYPDTGHGFLNEYAEMFGEHVRLFLDAEKVV